MALEKDWTDAELEAAIDAYLWMLNQELHRREYSKAEVNRKLREGSLAARSRGSVEYRMANISTVMVGLCLPRVEGYVPAKNVGAKVKERIKSVLSRKAVFDADAYQPTEDDKTLDARVRKLRKRHLENAPQGNKTPARKNQTASAFVRDPVVKAWVLQEANGICECCGRPGPFLSNDGSPYLEVHHIIPLGKGGGDETSNAVALCPNCHRACHFSGDRNLIITGLYRTIPRLSKQ